MDLVPLATSTYPVSGHCCKGFQDQRHVSLLIAASCTSRSHCILT